MASTLLLNPSPRDGPNAVRSFYHSFLSRFDFEACATQGRSLAYASKLTTKRTTIGNLATNGFTVHETSPADAEDMAKIFIVCHANDGIWKPMTSRISSEDRLEWVRRYYRNQAAESDTKSFGVVDTATKKMVAFTHLQYPYTYTAEDRAAILSKPGLRWPLGLNISLALEFAEICSSKACGYDPSKPFHRQGINTHPSYQRRGLGTTLSLLCNEIADKAGAKTYVVGRSNSLRMLQKTGFKTLATDHIDMAKYGGSKEDGKIWVLVREPVGNRPDFLQDPGEEGRHVP